MRPQLPDDRLIELAETVSTRPPGEREAFLREACNGDADLEKYVTEWIRLRNLAGDFLEAGAAQLLEPEEYFQPGDVLLNRFRIIREAGRGGMGIVYEAFDETLEKRVALKCAHSGFDSRLVPEVRHAIEISHPNVCKIFQIHHVPMEPGQQVGFIAMEYLDGPTLADHIRGRTVPEAEAKKIALELCRGLYAAHRNGVVHGDLKTNNIMLAKGPDGISRAVITDFGLARHGEPGGPGVQSGPRGGAPLFQAPEVRDGGRPSVVSDIYALGVVMYLMVTGRPPREGRSTVKLPPKWRAVIARALDPDPARRYQSADEVARALDPHPQPLFAAGAAAAILYLLFSPTVPQERIRLAVLPFAAPVSALPAADALHLESTERVGALRGGKRSLKVIPAHELRENGVDTLDEARALGVTHVLVTQVTETDDRYRVEAQLIDTGSGANIRPWGAEYRREELGALPVAIAGVVSGGLHLPAPAYAGTVAPAARVHYEEGLRLVRRNSQADQALIAFEKAAGADPLSALPQAGIAEACWANYWDTGDPAWKARAIDALRHAERLNPDVAEVLRISGLLSADAGWFEQAEITYRRAIELNPGDSTAWRRLGMALEAGNHDEEALAAYVKSAALEPSYFKPHQQLGAYFFQRARYSTALDHFRKASDLEPLESGVHYGLGHCFMKLGRFAEAEESLKTSFRLRATSKAADVLGLTLMQQDRDAEAVEHFMNALRLEPGFNLAHMHLGVALQRTGRGADAQRVFRTGLHLAERVMVENPRKGRERAMLAQFAARCGERRRVESEIAQALALSPKDDATLWRAVLTYEVLGQRENALSVLRDAPRDLLEDLTRWPEARPLQSDPRFIELLNLRNREEYK